MLHAILILIGAECSDFKFEKRLRQPDLTSEEVKRLVLLDTNYTYPVALAKSEALQIAQALDIEDKGKGVLSQRTIKESITYSIPDTIRFPKQTNRKNDPGIYVFNFSNAMGFAIISGDKRVLGRFGYSGAGVLNNDPHSGMRILMSRIVDYMQVQRKAIESMRGDKFYLSLINKLNSFHSQIDLAKDYSTEQSKDYTDAKLAPPSCDLAPLSIFNYSTTSTITIVPQIVQTKWDQIAPYNNNFASGCGLRFNNNCLQYSNSNYYAGCVPVSEAQVIANYFARANLGTWRSITNTDICNLTPDQVNSVAWLIKNVYNQYTIKFQNCKRGSFTFDQNFIGLTNDYGISPNYNLFQGEWRSYNNGDLEASLRNNSPVLLQGSQHQWCVFFNWGCGPDLTCMHQWIMDGMQNVNQLSYYTVTPVNYNTCTYLPSYTYMSGSTLSTYIHNNWGWGGDGDGWYFEGAFGGTTASGLRWPTLPSDNPYNHNDKMVAYITPL